MSNQAGKGSKPRPVNKKEFNKNFDQIKWESKGSSKLITNKNNKTTYKY